jgi:hypothetical protein
MRITRVASTSKTGTQWQLAQGIGASLHMSKLSCMPMRINTSTKGMMHAQKGCTKQLSQRRVSDTEGQGMLHIK